MAFVLAFGVLAVVIAVGLIAHKRLVDAGEIISRKTNVPHIFPSVCY